MVKGVESGENLRRMTARGRTLKHILVIDIGLTLWRRGGRAVHLPGERPAARK